MQTVHPSNRGQVLIIFVFAVLALIGITGLAIDGGNIYQDRRQAQNAADAAALGAALYRNNWVKGPPAHPAGCTNFNTEAGTLPSCSSDIINTALNMAKQNGYDNNPANQNSVYVYSPPKDGPYSVCGQISFSCYDYVEVIISHDVNTWFAKVLGIGQMHNRVEAVALSKHKASESLYGGSTMASLAPTGCDTFDVNGSADLTLNGGANIFVNSNGPGCATFVQHSCGSLTITPQTPVGVVGTGSAPTCTLPDQSTTSTTVPSVQFPPDPLFPEPSVCNDTVYTGGGTYDASDGTYHFPPAHYASWSLPQSKPSTLDPGVYCVDSLIKATGNTSEHYGDGVFIWIKAGGEFSFEGGTTVLSAPTSGTYAGYLVYVDWDPSVPAPVGTCKINGNGDSSYTGTIFAPYCHMQLNGTSGVGGWKAQMIGYDFRVNGTTDILFDHNNTPDTQAPEIDWTGLYH